MKRAKMMLTLLALGANLAGGTADASLWGGTCAFNVTISFTGGTMKSAAVATTSPEYTMTFTPLTDLDSAPDTQNCYVPLGLLSPFRGTTVTVDETTTGDIWTCENISSSGTWSQTFSADTPPPVVDASYHIRGNASALVMDIAAVDFSFVATVELAGFGLAQETQCLGQGITSLSLSAVEIFQDP